MVGQLAMGNVTGYGALALLNKVSLNTDTVGALNGATQVTNLGTLAYANAIAAEQIGAGQLAAGVVYAGNIYASQVMAGSFTGKEFIGGTFTGTVFRTAASGQRVQMDVTGSKCPSAADFWRGRLTNRAPGQQQPQLHPGQHRLIPPGAAGDQQRQRPGDQG